MLLLFFFFFHFFHILLFLRSKSEHTRSRFESRSQFSIQRGVGRQGDKDGKVLHSVLFSFPYPSPYLPYSPTPFTAKIPSSVSGPPRSRLCVALLFFLPFKLLFLILIHQGKNEPARQLRSLSSSYIRAVLKMRRPLFWAPSL